ncbi:hypothetical protein SDRG_11555 [Saprolegnia diclina VS20]|uniref:Uncharacterized protein n=1 Tax=Saprolegnia diclina (strain VS20) TaxID=1156394 RepID=T0PZ03_SAPDV|nr:hypothetical protein SDRG_11555 [Saprolegnia diclina VS20]EQC30794.1 hypothetical protein SDRG_11555 [Saprolegnia diclina VS20]|eukprot:XP_008615818.1 hypothetical protein SDRG_11555 [Saprolegnia diclina VS20]
MTARLVSESEDYDDELVSESEDYDDEPTAAVEKGALCLLCQARPRTAGMAHGYYIHIYCCFECGKKVFREQKVCDVCTRPIDRVMHVLPLSTQAEAWIRNVRESASQASDWSIESRPDQ